MKLDFLCELQLTYRGEIVVVRPFETGEGSAYGEGDGEARGERLSGAVRWANWPRRRSDGTFLPNVHGVIETGDGAKVLFSLEGRTTFKDGARGLQSLAAIFETEHERYRWLNDVLCVLEGVIEARAMRARVYVCGNEMA